MKLIVAIVLFIMTALIVILSVMGFYGAAFFTFIFWMMLTFIVAYIDTHDDL